MCDKLRGWRTHQRPPRAQNEIKIFFILNELELVARSKFRSKLLQFCAQKKNQPQRGTSNRKTLFSASILRFLTSFRVVGYWRRFFVVVVVANMEKAAEIIVKGVNTELSSSSFGVDLPIGNISRFKKLELFDFFVSFCAIYESLSGSFFFRAPRRHVCFCYATFLFSAAFREPLFTNLVVAEVAAAFDAHIRPDTFMHRCKWHC